MVEAAEGPAEAQNGSPFMADNYRLVVGVSSFSLIDPNLHSVLRK